jgi:hypothetical protein
MIVLLANTEQYAKLNGYTNGTSELSFVQDNNDRWIVGVEVLGDLNFSEILNELLILERIEFVEKIVEDRPTDIETEF